jgi:hypothetical protein
VNVRHETKRPSRRRNTVAAAVWSCLLVTFAAAVSGAQDSGTSDWERPDSACEPACRSGYECRRGECTPVCSPACEEGYLCSADGGCIPAQPRAVPAPALESRAPELPNACEPSCRSGFTCKHLRCVSLCNPLCPPDEVCTASGECVSAHLADHVELDVEQGPAHSPAPDRDSSADSLVNLHIDAAGLLQFGLTPTIEVGESVSGYLRLRIMNTGLASYFLLGRDADDHLRIGAGAALGVHFFSSKRGNMRGLYGGAAMEYAFFETRDDSVDFAIYRTHVLIPQLDFGYRWAFGQFFLGVSGKLGLAIPFKSTAVGIGETPCARATSCTSDLSAAFVPGVGLDLGWFLPR